MWLSLKLLSKSYYSCVYAVWVLKNNTMNFIVSLQSLIKAFVMSHKCMTKVINKSVICSIAHLFLLQIMLFTKLMLGLNCSLIHNSLQKIPLRSKLNVTEDRNKQTNKQKHKYIVLLYNSTRFGTYSHMTNTVSRKRSFRRSTLKSRRGCTQWCNTVC